MRLIQARLNIRNRPRSHLTEDDLTIGQKIHMKRGDYQASLRLHYVILGFGIGLVVLTLLVTVPAIQFFESFGHYEERILSHDGPACNSDDFTEKMYVDWPAIIIGVSDGSYEAGILEGDTVVRLNDLDIKKNGDLEEWWKDLPEVKSGDYVDVVVLRDGQEITFNVKTVASTDFEGDIATPRIGTQTAEFADPCYEFFIPSKFENFTPNDLEKSMLSMHFAAMLGVVIGAMLIVIFLAVWRNQSKLISELDEWEDHFIDEDYIVTFSTTKPEGKTNGQKVFNLARKVFPELRTKDTNRPLKWAGVVKNSNGYKFDVFQPFGEDTDNVLVVKHFGDTVVTLEKVNETIAEVNFAVKDQEVHEKVGNPLYVDRLIIVAKKYDDSIIPTMSPTWDDLDSTKLEETMDELVANFAVDFMEEDTDGRFNVLWVDSMY